MHTRTTIARFLPPIPWWLRGYRICLQCRRLGSDPWWGKIPWRKEWLPTRIFLPKKFYEQRILVSYSPWGHKESDTTDQLTLHFSRRYMCHLAISVKSLMLGELNATVKICLCTHILHITSCITLLSKQIKSWNSSFPKGENQLSLLLPI